MEKSKNTTPHYQQENFLEAINHFAHKPQFLLTIGQIRVIQSYVNGSLAAQTLYAILFHRRPTSFFIDDLVVKYRYRMDVTRAVSELNDLGFVTINDRSIQTKVVLNELTKKDLHTIVDKLGIQVSKSVKKTELIKQLHGKCHSRDIPAYLTISYKDLFKIIFSHYLCSNQGDLTELIRTQVGHLKYYKYQQTRSQSFYRTRKELRLYYQGKAALQKYHNCQDLLANSKSAKEIFLSIEKPLSWRYKFSAWRMYKKLVYAYAEELERKKHFALAVELYESIRHELPDAWIRLVLTLEKLQNPHKAVDFCAQGMENKTITLDAKLQLNKSGKRIARRNKIRWKPMIPLQPIKTREMKLHQLEEPSKRPKFLIGNDGFYAEQAIINILSDSNRQCYFGENSPWKALKSLLFLEEIFTPIENALPSPVLACPLDFHSKSFYQTRQRILEQKIAKISDGQAVEILEQRRGLEKTIIAGVNWHSVSIDYLIHIVKSIPALSLTKLMRLYLKYPRETRRGMPDLYVLPGVHQTKIVNLFPAKLPQSFFLIEVKTQSDKLSEQQIAWFQRLNTIGIHAEVWKIRSLK